MAKICETDLKLRLRVKELGSHGLVEDKSEYYAVLSRRDARGKRRLAWLQWLNYSARGDGSLRARGLKGRSSSPKDRKQRWGSRPPTMGFRAFKALCLAFMAFK